MHLLNLARRLFGYTSVRPHPYRHAPARARLALEVLEDRRLLATSAFYSMPTNLAANQGTVVTVPVSISHLFDAVSDTGLAASFAVLTYDPTVFTVTNSDVTPGGLLTNPPPSGNWNFNANTATPGEIDINAFSPAQALDVTGQTGGVLANVQFHVKGSAPTGSSTIHVVVPAEVSPNGISGSALPDQGPHSASGDGTGYQLIPADQVDGIVNIQNFQPVSELFIPTGQSGTAGTTISVVVDIANPFPAGSAGMISADAAVLFDPALLTVASSGAVSAGNIVPAAGWSVSYSVDTSGANGIDPTKAALALHIVNTDNKPLMSTATDSLWVVKFSISPAASGSTQLNLVPSAIVGSVGTTTNIQGANKTYQLNPAPSNASNDPVDGSINFSSSSPTVGQPTVTPNTTDEGAVTTFDVTGTFTDPLAAAAGPFLAEVDWGDGSSRDSATVSTSGGVFSYDFNGQHTYAQNGTYQVTVIVTNNQGQSGTSNPTPVFVNNVAPTVAAPTVVPSGTDEGLTTTFTVSGTFTDPAGALDQSYSVLVDWGDGSPQDVGTASGSANPFNYSFTGSHTYAQSGQYAVTVRVADAQEGTGISPPTFVNVANVAPTVSAPTITPSSVLEGATTTFTVSGTFSDPADALDQSYLAVINWGDGTTDSATVSGATNPFNYDFTGNHTYAEEGTFQVTVSVTDMDGGTGNSPAVQITVADQQLTNLASGNLPANGLENVAIGSITGIATFTDPAGPEVAAVDYSATVNWGDGTTNTGTVVDLGGGNYRIDAPDHIYVEEGSFTVNVTLQHDLLAPLTTPDQTIVVSDQDLATTGGFSFTAVEGAAAASQTVATFTDPAGPEVLSDYAASIDWGDGTNSAGTITLSGTTFTVSASHTYAEEGAYTIAVTISHDSTSPQTVFSTAMVSDPSVIATGGFTVNATEGAPSAQQTVATFTDPPGAEALSDYSASIDWGDGTAASAGTITVAAGTFTVTGSHSYGDSGSYNITVTISHDTAAATNVNSNANVTNAPPTVSAPFVVPSSSSEGTATTFNVSGTFTDPAGALDQPYAAVILWGDGGSDTATVAPGEGNFTYSFSGSHTYAQSGPYQVTASVTDKDGGNGTSAPTQINVANLAPTVAAPAVNPTTAQAGFATTFTVSGTFSDPAGSLDQPFTATVNWGDGTSDPATVNPGNAAVPPTYSFNGGHTYASPGIYNVTVSVTDKDSGTGTSAGTPVNAVAYIPPTLGPLSQSVGALNQAFATTIPINDGLPAFGNLVVSGLPPGMSASVNGRTITLSGTPTVASLYCDVEVSVTDSMGSVAADEYMLVINAPPFSFNESTGTLTITGKTFTYSQAMTAGEEGSLQPTYTFIMDGFTEVISCPELTHVVVNAPGGGGSATLFTNDTFVSNGLSQETTEIALLGPGGSGQLQKFTSSGQLYVFMQLNGFVNSFAYLGNADNSRLYGSPASDFVGGPVTGLLYGATANANVFITDGTFSYISAPGILHYVSGGAYVYAYAATPLDSACHFTGSGMTAVVMSGTAFSYASGTDNGQAFFNVGVGFKFSHGISQHPGQDVAYFIDSQANDVFVGLPGYSYMYNDDDDGDFAMLNEAYGFSLVFSQSFVGGIDFAYLYDSQHNITTGFVILLGP